MLKDALRDAFSFNLAGSRARAGLPCTLAIAIALLIGLSLGRPVVGLVAAGGAMSVGFGAFQTLGRSRILPMFWASIGMGLSAALGSLVPHNTPGLIANAAFFGFGYGILTALGPGWAWIPLQCGIAGLVATAYPTGLATALGRGALILAGGFLQMGIVTLFRRFHSYFRPAASYQDSFAGFRPALETLRENLIWSAMPFRYAMRLSVTLAVAAAAARLLVLSNGYWVPMTALLVLRTQIRETYSRGLARLAGTFVGAGLATLLASELRPDMLTLTALIVLFAWLCYTVINVNYGAFSVCVTAYIAFLLALAGLPEQEVALHRLANTALGGALALAAAATALFPSRPQPVNKTI